ncbi:MAG: hypothetical protein H3C48_14180, partial [Chitinophagaceae bacterium]|nr:hypothetical protein [Chitinophagaceae bacterium]
MGSENESAEENNPKYDVKGYDRWGTYKSAADNPDGLSNADYPYTLQEGNQGFSKEKQNQNISAWTLTDILTPSAGRINVEYESDDYAFVQNKRAMQMCSLAGMGRSSNLSESQSLLYQDLEHDHLYAFIKIPSPIQSDDAEGQKKEIKRKYLAGVEKLYFRLSVQMPADIYGSGEEHVSTYARYEDYGVTEDPYIIWIRLKGTHRIKGEDGDASPLAKTAIQVLRLNLPSKAYPNSDLDGEFDAQAVVRASFALIQNLGELFTKFPTQARMKGWAKKFNSGRSFVRLNNPDFKKYGDGLRVKRITVYDNWATLTNGQEQEATYGQEYDYTTTKDIDGVKMSISSGVASYEPNIGNDENPFRLPVEYQEQVAPLAPISNMYSEFPLGEMFYPAASVGYSKVRVRTIHHQDIRSATGYVETEYYTTYDFPTLVDRTPLEIRRFNSENLLNLFNLYSKKALTFSQGFKVELNDMNGKMKATASYSEDDPDNAQSYTRYYYKVDDQHAEAKHLNNTVAVADSANGHLNMEAQIGKDIEIMTDMREQTFMSQGASIELNADGFMIGIIPVVTVMPWVLPHLEMRRFRSSAVTKVVNRYGILDKVMVYDKGSLVTTENLLYDGETGDVLLTKTINEFNDPVYQFNYPAHWAYSGMEPAYKNTGAIFNNISFRDGKIIGAPGYSDIDRFFESGDEIMVKGGWGRTQLKDGINKCTGFGVCDNTSPVPITTKKLWAVDAAKLSRNPKLKGMYFIDEEGRFFTGDNNRLQIIRSGKRNMPALNIGSVTSLENPLQKVGGKWQLVLDKTTRVVNTAAVSYSDFWQVEDARYQPKTMTIKKNALKKLVLNPVPDAGFSISRDYRLGVWPFVSGYNNYYAFANTPYFEASSNIPGNNGDTRYAHNLESWLKFDLGVLPAGADIVNAQLSLYPHMGEHQEIRGMPRSMEKRNHTNNLPHHYTDEAGGNESYVHIDFNPTLNNLNPQNSFVDNSPLIRGILDTKTYLSTQRAIVYSTKKQNSVLLNVKDLITASLDRRGATTTWFRIKGPESKGYRRLCFWSTDSYLNPFASDEDCIAMYGPLNNSDPNANNSNFGTNPSTRTSNRLDEGAVALDIGQINNNNSANAIGCPTCSAVDPGYGKFPCPTRPQLTIEYIACEPGFSLIQECDSFYCVKTVPVEDCLSRITDTTANPYRWGILGNWRVERAYSYYDDRTEKNIPGNNNNTNIREYGTVNNFKAFWKFTDKGITPIKDTTKWVWNTHSTLFNRKGFELENKDPLNRHNAVQYGYNESMPIAVTQNARYTEHAFDGFEDYAYKNEPCETPCKVQKHTDNQPLNDYVTNEDAHSGLYSLGIDVGNSVAFSAPVEDASQTPP